jgi:4'-phosphopantetheinyl transferase
MSSPALECWEQAPLSPDLRPGEVHVWQGRVNGSFGHHDDLSNEECARAERFRFEEDRRRWVAAHILLRRVLARYLGVPPKSLAIGADDEGRPLVQWPHDAEWLSFSLSHAGDVALVAVTRDQRVGVDVEEIRADVDVVAVARRAFGDAVATELAGEPESRRTQRFFEIWTREEARGKCRGTGLIEPNDLRRLDAAHVTDLTIGHGYVAALAGSHGTADVRQCLAAL